MDDDEQAPPEIAFEDVVFDLAFHPTHDVVAAGLITGAVELHRYGVEANEIRWQDTTMTQACRGLAFSVDGSYLFAAGKDKSMRMLDVSTGKCLSTVTAAHQHAVNRLCVLDERLMATGDDEGVVKIWDLRASSNVMEYEECEDYISDFCYRPEQRVLLATSGDGTLSVLNMRKMEVTKRSDYMDEELLAVAVLKHGTKVVCGTQEGVLAVFNWGEWGDVSDRFPGHPASVDTVVPLTESLFATGSSDGLVRVVQLHPNKLVGVVGEHQDFPIERMQLSRDRVYLGSCSHDKTIRFWNVNGIANGGAASTSRAGDDDDMEEDTDSDADSDAMDAAPPAVKDIRQNNFFDDL